MITGDVFTIDYHEIIESIASALDAKDSYTANHSIRVSDMSKALCNILGISEIETEKIHIAAHLHDIGKMSIPDHILNKKGELSTIEWEIMKQHPTMGVNIIEKSPGLKSISKIILHHHERWDGKGYPFGISNEDIPFGSRIIAVCDSVDAMMSNRSYRCSLPVELCFDEIKKNIGKMYDPEIGKCMLDHWDRLAFV